MIDDGFSALYAEFGRGVGLPGLEVDAYGNGLLDIDKIRLHVLHMREVQEVLLSARSAKLPAYPQPPLLTWLLTESLEQCEKRGAAFAIDPQENCVIVLRRMSTKGLTVADFAREIETLVSLAEAVARETGARAAVAPRDTADMLRGDFVRFV
jgi:hypothetical protein